MVVNVHIYKKLPYDPVKDFVPIGQLVNQANVLVVNPSVPAKSTTELVKIAKSNPRKLTFGSNGVGSSQHISAELFMAMTGARMIDVAYKGGSAAITELVAGQIDLSFAVVPTALPMIQSHRLRALAVTSAQRSAMLPDVPTMQEAGLTNYEYGNWMGLFGPAAMKQDVVASLNAALHKVLGTPDVRKRLTDLGLDPVSPGTPQSFAEFMRKDMEKHAKLFATIGKPAQ
jgi:tripartite-type tricarboxylate transporter receptor subunit TctC